MIQFNAPVNLDGTVLRQELNTAGVKISDVMTAVKLDGNVLWLDIAKKDEDAANLIVAAHNAGI